MHEHSDRCCCVRDYVTDQDKSDRQAAIENTRYHHQKVRAAGVSSSGRTLLRMYQCTTYEHGRLTVAGTKNPQGTIVAMKIWWGGELVYEDNNFHIKNATYCETWVNALNAQARIAQTKDAAAQFRARSYRRTTEQIRHSAGQASCACGCGY
jgi:hypothetical protein